MRCLGGNERAWAMSTHDVSSACAVWEHTGDGKLGCTEHIVRDVFWSTDHIVRLGVDHIVRMYSLGVDWVY